MTDLKVYTKTTSQIHPTYIVYKDAEVETEYQMVYVGKMGGMFISAVSIVFLATAMQAAVIIAVSQSEFVLITQLLNLGCFIPVYVVSLLRYLKLIPALSYRYYQTMALVAVFIMFMSPFWGIMAVIYDQRVSKVLDSERIFLMGYAIHQSSQSFFLSFFLFTLQNSHSPLSC